MLTTKILAAAPKTKPISPHFHSSNGISAVVMPEKSKQKKPRVRGEKTHEGLDHLSFGRCHLHLPFYHHAKLSSPATAERRSHIFRIALPWWNSHTCKGDMNSSFLLCCSRICRNSRKDSAYQSRLLIVPKSKTSAF